jgi:putative SOS response-associated peptidase YedK
MTTAPNAEMAELHDRMPVIVEKENWPTWLGEVDGDHLALIGPAPDGCYARGHRRGFTEEQRGGAAEDDRRIVRT